MDDDARISFVEASLRRGSGGARKSIELLVEETPVSSPHFHRLVLLRLKFIRSEGSYIAANEFIEAYLAEFDSTLSPIQRRDVYSSIAENNRLLGMHVDAWARHLRLMREATLIQNHTLWVWAVLGMARIAFDTGNFGLAARLFSGAGHISADRGDYKNLAWGLRGLADCLIAQDDYDGDLIEMLLRRAGALFARADHLAGELWTLMSWGDYWKLCGAVDRSAEYYKRSVQGFLPVDRRGSAFARTKLALVNQQSADERVRATASAELRSTWNFFESNGLLSGLALFRPARGPLFPPHPEGQESKG